MLGITDGQTASFKNGMLLVDGRQFPYYDGACFSDGATMTGEVVRRVAIEGGALFSGRAAVLAPRITGWTRMQIQALCDRDAVAERMFNLRFGHHSGSNNYDGILLAEAREVSSIYKNAFGPTFSRDLDSDWDEKDDANFRLSIANNELYRLIFPRLSMMGLLMQAGFVHRSAPLSILYDVSDFYKALVTVSVAAGTDGRDARAIKVLVRESWSDQALAERIGPDLRRVFQQ